MAGKWKVRAGYILITFMLLISIRIAYSDVTGADVTYKGNATRASTTNLTLNESTDGGYIYKYKFTAREQNQRWKAYVGNVSGALTLDNADNVTIFDWDLGITSGEVYATRTANTVTWSNVNCSWAVTGNSSNRTVSQNEDSAMSHTRLDNITATFGSRVHSTFLVGERTMTNNSCYSVHPYINDTSQSSNFHEMILYDGTTASNGNVVYAAIVENNIYGYNNRTYDFQMIVPENGADSFSSSTEYYFYVELS